MYFMESSLNETNCLHSRGPSHAIELLKLRNFHVTSSAVVSLLSRGTCHTKVPCLGHEAPCEHPNACKLLSEAQKISIGTDFGDSRALAVSARVTTCTRKGGGRGGSRHFRTLHLSYPKTPQILGKNRYAGSLAAIATKRESSLNLPHFHSFANICTTPSGHLTTTTGMPKL